MGKFSSASPALRSIILRIVSALILAPIVIAAVALGGRFFAGLIAFANVVMIFEWTRMVEKREFSASFYILSVAATGALFSAAEGNYTAAYLICSAAAAASYAVSRLNGGLGHWPAFAAPYIIAPSIALIWLRFYVEDGRDLTYLLFIIVWAADTGAFITGKLIGGPKISHALSPSKTWSGIGGGVVGGVIAGAFGSAYLLTGAPWLVFFFFGGLLGAASVCGDLAESAFKRRWGVKDISGFIPGHGGALDRLDGMIFATIVMALGAFLFSALGAR